MKIKNQLNSQIPDEKLVQIFTNILQNKLSDYTEYERRYRTASQKMAKLMCHAPIQLSSMIALHTRKIASDIYYAASLGYKANLEHFRNPLLQTFIDMDAESYLCEHIMKAMPKRVEAEQILKEYHSMLTDEQKKGYDEITTYFMYLETVCPKIAHFYGYLEGNRTLPCTEPGYTEDRVLTFRYRHMLQTMLDLKEADRIFADV